MNSTVAEKPQHLSALESANRVRLARTERKRQIAALTYADGKDQVAAMICDPPDLWLTASLEYVLRMPQRAGWSFVARMCRGAGVSQDRRLGSLTVRQRLALANQVSASVVHEFVRENF